MKTWVFLGLAFVSNSVFPIQLKEYPLNINKISDFTVIGNGLHTIKLPTKFLKKAKIVGYPDGLGVLMSTRKHFSMGLVTKQQWDFPPAKMTDVPEIILSGDLSHIKDQGLKKELQGVRSVLLTKDMVIRGYKSNGERTVYLAMGGKYSLVFLTLGDDHTDSYVQVSMYGFNMKEIDEFLNGALQPDDFLKMEVQ